MRRRLIRTSVAGVAAALFLLTLVFWVVLSRSLDHDADLVLRSRAEATLATLEFTPQGLLVEDPPLDDAIDANAWVFDASGKALTQPRAEAGASAAARALRTSRTVRYRDVGNLRLLALPALDRGTVVVSVSRVPYQDSRRIALLSALALDVLVLGLVTFLTRRVVRAALRPVAAMTEQALEWSERDLDHRFAWGPPRDELGGLAANLDVLLERVAINLRHERRLSAEIAHELRTPLARLRSEAEITLLRPRPPAEMRAALQAVVAHAAELTQVIDTLLEFSRSEVASTGCQVGDVLDGLGEVTVLPLAAPSLRVGCEADLVVRILAPLLHNAQIYGRTTPVLQVREEDGAVVFAVTDDGPGVQKGEEEAIFEPAHRGSAAHLGQGLGLGLALSRRLARAAGGDVVAVAATGGGVFQLRLPQA